MESQSPPRMPSERSFSDAPSSSGDSSSVMKIVHLTPAMKQWASAGEGEKEEGEKEMEKKSVMQSPGSKRKSINEIPLLGLSRASPKSGGKSGGEVGERVGDKAIEWRSDDKNDNKLLMLLKNRNKSSGHKKVPSRPRPAKKHELHNDKENEKSSFASALKILMSQNRNGDKSNEQGKKQTSVDSNDHSNEVPNSDQDLEDTLLNKIPLAIVRRYETNDDKLKHDKINKKTVYGTNKASIKSAKEKENKIAQALQNDEQINDTDQSKLLNANEVTSEQPSSLKKLLNAQDNSMNAPNNEVQGSPAEQSITSTQNATSPNIETSENISKDLKSPSLNSNKSIPERPNYSSGNNDPKKLWVPRKRQMGEQVQSLKDKWSRRQVNLSQSPEQSSSYNEGTENGAMHDGDSRHPKRSKKVDASVDMEKKRTRETKSAETSYNNENQKKPANKIFGSSEKSMSQIGELPSTSVRRPSIQNESNIDEKNIFEGSKRRRTTFSKVIRKNNFGLPEKVVSADNIPKLSIDTTAFDIDSDNSLELLHMKLTEEQISGNMSDISSEDSETTEDKVQPTPFFINQLANLDSKLQSDKDIATAVRSYDHQLSNVGSVFFNNNKEFKRDEISHLIESGVPKHRPLCASRNVSSTNDICSKDNFQTSHAFFYQQYGKNRYFVFPRVGNYNSELVNKMKKSSRSSRTEDTVAFKKWNSNLHNFLKCSENLELPGKTSKRRYNSDADYQNWIKTWKEILNSSKILILSTNPNSRHDTAENSKIKKELEELFTKNFGSKGFVHSYVPEVDVIIMPRKPIQDYLNMRNNIRQSKVEKKRIVKLWTYEKASELFTLLNLTESGNLNTIKLSQRLNNEKTSASSVSRVKNNKGINSPLASTETDTGNEKSPSEQTSSSSNEVPALKNVTSNSELSSAAASVTPTTIDQVATSVVETAVETEIPAENDPVKRLNLIINEKDEEINYLKSLLEDALSTLDYQHNKLQQALKAVSELSSEVIDNGIRISSLTTSLNMASKRLKNNKSSKGNALNCKSTPSVQDSINASEKPSNNHMA